MTKKSRVDKAIEEAQSLLNILRNLVDQSVQKSSGESGLVKLYDNIAELDRRISRLEIADRNYKAEMAAFIPDDWMALITHHQPSLMQ